MRREELIRIANYEVRNALTGRGIACVIMDDQVRFSLAIDGELIPFVCDIGPVIHVPVAGFVRGETTE